MNTKVSENKQKKEVIVGEISEKVQKAKGLVFTNYQGLTHKQLEGFKKELRKLDAEFAISKNTLLKIALGKEKVSGNEDKFEQPTGTLFLYGDTILPLKALAKMVKTLQLPEIKFGIVEGRSLTSSEVIKLSTLPSREVLLGQLVGQLKSPLYSLHRALQWNMQTFVMTLKAIENKKPTS